MVVSVSFVVFLEERTLPQGVETFQALVSSPHGDLQRTCEAPTDENLLDNRNQHSLAAAVIWMPLMQR